MRVAISSSSRISTRNSKRRRKKAPVISPIAVEVVRRIDAISDIERAINGRSADERLAARQEHGAKPVADLEAWLRDNRSKLSKSGPVAEPIDYRLKAWPAFTAFLDDGRICLSNNAAEWALSVSADGTRPCWWGDLSERQGRRRPCEWIVSSQTSLV